MTTYQLIELVIDGMLTAGIVTFCVLLVKFRASVHRMIASNAEMVAASNTMKALISDHQRAMRDFLDYIKPLLPPTAAAEEPPARPN